MTALSNNIRSIDDYCPSCTMDKASNYFDFGQADYDLSPQLCNPIDINCWSFSPLPSPESPYLDRPLSNTYQDQSRNACDQTFGSLMTPDSMDCEFVESEPLASVAYQNAFNDVAEYERAKQWSVAAVDTDSVPASQVSTVFAEFSPTRESHPSSPQVMTNEVVKSLPHHRTSSRSPRLSKRIKPQKETSTSPADKSPHQRLRSTSTQKTTNSRPSNSSTSSYSASSPPKHTRLNHNQIEKQYRNRLNGQFETLLLALPKEDGDERDGGEERKVSKAEVLNFARKHIRDLERDGRRLEEENETLGGVMGG